MMVEVTILMSCKPFSDARMSLLCNQVVLFRDNSRTSLWKFATWCLFMLRRFPLSSLLMHSQKNWLNFFGQVLKKKIFAFVGKWLEHLESREFLCVHRPKILTVSAGPRYKILREWIRCVYNNVIDPLCLATNQSTSDQKEQTLHLDTSQLVLNQDPTVCQGKLFPLRHGETWREQCECFVSQRLFLVCSGDKGFV